MDLILLAGIILLAYVGAALALLYAKEDYKNALVPGTIAWIIVVIMSFFIPVDVLIVLLLAIALGVVIQLIIPTKAEAL